MLKSNSGSTMPAAKSEGPDRGGRGGNAWIAALGTERVAASMKGASPSPSTIAFIEYRVAPPAFIVTSCGSGVSAAVLTLALYRLGVENPALYDGSWSEWGQAGGPPIATGPAGVVGGPAAQLGSQCLRGTRARISEADQPRTGHPVDQRLCVRGPDPSGTDETDPHRVGQ